MRLTKKQWRVLGHCVGFVHHVAGEPRLGPVLERLGLHGQHGASEGVDPLTGPARHDLIHALRALVAEANRLESAAVSDDLLRVIMYAEEVLAGCEHARRRSR